MATVFRIIGLIISYGPFVLRVVQQIEELIKGTGEEKKTAAMKLVKEYFVARNIAWTQDREKLVSSLIDFAVQSLNFFNGWRKGRD